MKKIRPWGFGFMGALVAACSGGGAADVGAGATRSAVSGEGDFALYFTNPVPALIKRFEKQPHRFPEYAGDAVASWNDIATRDVAGGRDLEGALVQLIDAARGASCAVLVADYDFDLQTVADAMVRAQKRGCDVRLVTDGDTIVKSVHGTPDHFQAPYEKPFGALRDAKIPIHHDGSRGAIMHNKFLVARGTDLAAVWVGSWNFTTDDGQSFWNNGMRLDSAELARRYTVDFEALFTRFGADGSVSSTRPPVSFDGHEVPFGDMKLEVYFPSTDRATDRIVELLSGAQQTIDVLAFSFTSHEMTKAVTERVQAGVKLRGVWENSGACSGAFRPLSDIGGDAASRVDLLRWPYGPTNFMHHKVFVIDGETVVFSSFNFSDSADQANDENVVIVHDEKIAKSFTEIFENVRAATVLSPQPAACGAPASTPPTP